MLMDLEKLVEKYKMKITGVIHIGAHHGNEIDIYKKLGIKNAAFFEPLKANFEILQQKAKGYGECHRLALGNFNGWAEMYVETANQGQSSSLLKPKVHLKQYPHIQFPLKETVKVARLDDLIVMLGGCNFINIDVQGYELEVFKGAENKLEQIDYIMAEVNREELYESCAHVDQLDVFLGDYLFERVETDWAGITWGDALYVRTNIPE